MYFYKQRERQDRTRLRLVGHSGLSAAAAPALHARRPALAQCMHSWRYELHPREALSPTRVILSVALFSVRAAPFPNTALRALVYRFAAPYFIAALAFSIWHHLLALPSILCYPTRVSGTSVILCTVCS